MELLGNEFFAWLKVWHDWFPVDLTVALAVLLGTQLLVSVRFIPWAIVLVGVLY